MNQPIAANLLQPTIATPLTLFDTHAHLGDESFAADLPAVLANAERMGVKRFITIGAGDGIAGNQRALEIAAITAGVSPSLGIHPHEASLWNEALKEQLEKLCRQSKARPVAIGETGLDYHYNYSPPEVQRQAFRAQLNWAVSLKLPVIVHSREAHADTVALLKEFSQHIKASGGVIHCFSEDAPAAEEYLELGMHLSFSGIVTFPKAEPIRAALKLTPHSRLLIETDCPYLAPLPHRGKRCEPACVYYTALKVAEVLETEPEQLAKITYQNGCNLFKAAP